jgi:hypothetical protein
LLAVVLAGCAACATPPSHGGGGDDDDQQGTPDADLSDQSCGEWKIGTLTGYNNSNLADDPNAGSVMEFTGLTEQFYNEVNMAAVDFSDWDGDKYHYVDVMWEGQIGRVGVWDACRNEDCPDGTQCCTNNKERFAQPGYLVDIETRSAQRLFGISDAEDTLNDQIQYRVCGAFDPDQIANSYGVFR